MKIANADKLKKHFENVVDVKLFTVPEICTIIDTFTIKAPIDLTDDITKATEEDVIVTCLTKGEWNKCNDDKFDWLECSSCGYGDEGEVTKPWLYCPVCGAFMVNSPMNKLGGTQP